MALIIENSILRITIFLAYCLNNFHLDFMWTTPGRMGGGGSTKAAKTNLSGRFNSHADSTMWFKLLTLAVFGNKTRLLINWLQLFSLLIVYAFINLQSVELNPILQLILFHKKSIFTFTLNSVNIQFKISEYSFYFPIFHCSNCFF